jgi:hypothetical protein
MKNIITALAAARTEMANPKKTATNPAFRSKFADLAAILDAIEPSLAKNGLVVTQTIRVDGERHLLDTTLWHTSGESLLSTALLEPEKCTLQGLGSAITYLRRYQLQALLCLAAEDDDGNTASGTAPKTTPSQRVERAPSPAPATPSEPASAAALGMIEAIAKAADLPTLTRIVAPLSDAQGELAKTLSASDKSHIRTAFMARRSELASL